MSTATAANDIPLRQRLAYRLSLNILVAAVLIGLVLSLAQIGYDFATMRASQDRAAEDILRAHQAAAALAAYNIDDQSAREVVRGMLQHRSVASAGLRNEADELASRSRPDYAPAHGAGQRWFPRYKAYATTLAVPAMPEAVGRLELVVDQDVTLDDVLLRAAVTLGTGLLFNLILAGVLLMVVHLTVTRRLIRLMTGLNSIEPEHPRAELLALAIEKESSELGLLAGKLRGLLASIARNIELRERAERQLQAINEGLETEVQERTRCLELANNKLLETLSELHSAQARLLESEKLAAIGQLSAGVAHEINNPIAFVTGNIGALRGYFESLLRLVDTYEQVEKELAAEPLAGVVAGVVAIKNEIDLDFLRQDAPVLLQECADGLARVKSIVSDLREYAGDENPQWERVDLDDYLDAAVQRCRGQLPPEVELKRVFGDAPTLDCLPAPVNQMIHHLLNNAIQAVAGKGLVTLGVRAEGGGGGVSLEVTDNGCGIPEASLRHIFDPFYTTRPVGQGRGLGLSVVYNTVKRHGGRIHVDSRPGKGTRFRIWLPQTQPAQPQGETLSFA